MGLLTALAVPAAAAGDLGAMDTMALEATITPCASSSDFNVVLEAWAFNDSNQVFAASIGWTWSNPNMTMTGATPSSLAKDNFDQLLFYDRSSLDSTNAKRRFQFVSITFGLGKFGIPPAPERRLWATYNFTLSDWSVNDVVFVKDTVYSAGVKVQFIDYPDLESYLPYVNSNLEIRDCDYVPVTGQLEVSPSQLDFTAIQGDADPAPQNFTVSEASADNIAYTASETSSWISLTNPTGTTPGDVTVNVNITGLSEGAYTDSVMVSSEEAVNSPQWVKVQLVVEGPRVLLADPTSLSFNATQGDTGPLLDTIAVTEQGGAEITFSATTAQAWLSVNLLDNTTPGSIQVSADPTGLIAGTYRDTVTISAAAPTASIKVPVEFTIVEPPKFLQVDPTSLSFTATEGSTTALLDSLTVTEQGGFEIIFAATATQAWTTVNVTDDTTPGKVLVTVDPTGVAAGVYEDTVLIAAVDAEEDLKVPVTLTVNEPGKYLTITPDTLMFEISEGDVSYPSNTFNVDEQGGYAVAFVATTASTWIGLTADSAGTTPSDVTVNINATGVGPGTYVDSVMVSSEEVLNSPQYAYVKLVILPCPSLVLSDTAATVEITAGETTNFTDTLEVTSSGPGEITFVMDADTNFAVSFSGDVTPATVIVGYDVQYDTPGEYQACITFSSAENAENTCFSSATYCLNIVVNEKPCVNVLVSDTLVNFTAIEGAEYLAPLFDSVMVYSSDSNENFAFTATKPIDAAWLSFGETGPFEGATPATVPLYVDPNGVAAGTYEAIVIVTSTDDIVCDPKFTQFTVHLQVFPAPSSDTVIVATEPAVPGMQVTVPVTFASSCELHGAGLQLNWTSGMVHLDSVSYAGSDIADFDHIVDINNDESYVMLSEQVGTSATPLLPGSGYNWANLHFTVSCDIGPGTVSFGLGAPLAVDPVFFDRDCGGGIEVKTPEFVAGAIVVDTSANYVCGWVVEPDGLGGFKSVEGAMVELYADFPYGEAIQQTSSGWAGNFAFADFTTIPFDLYAYKAGYYPGTVTNLNFGDKGVQIVLHPLAELTPTDQWVDYYCETNTLLGVPLPVGSIVEAYDPDGVLCGQQMVDEPGKYRFMPVYRDSAGSAIDEGATTDDIISFYVNGEEAMADGDVIYPPAYAQKQVCLSAGATITKTCDLAPGWNLVSWSVNTETDNILDVLGPYMDCIDVILGFERGGLTYDPDLQQFSTLWYVDHMSGYWIKVDTSCTDGITLELSGLPVLSNTPIPVTTGWNLVSYLPDYTLAPDAALESILGDVMIAYGFDAGIQIFVPGQTEFNKLEQMGPCFGYWVKVSADGDLIYPGQGPVVASHGVDRQAEAAAKLVRPDVTPTTSWVNVYSADLTLDGKAVMPGADIAAYSTEGKKIGGFTVMESGKFGFMPVYADDANNSGVTGLKRGDPFYLTVNGAETTERFTWTTNGDRIEVGALTSKTASDNTLPTTYSLAQNYPNPFNPTTNINFTMPVTAKATITVYNVLGKVVAVPFDGMATAGENVVTWNGRDMNGDQVASGVYFYRLSTDKYTETRKMMLLK